MERKQLAHMHPPQILTPVYPSTDNPGLFQFSPRTLPQLLFTDKTPLGFPRCVGKSLMAHKPGEHLQMGAYDIFEPCPDAPL